MPADLPAGPDSPPTDELDSAEASLSVLQHVLHAIANDDSVQADAVPRIRHRVADRPPDELDHRHRRRRRCGAPRAGSAPTRWSGRSSSRHGLRWTRGNDAASTAPCKFGDNEAPAKVMAGILSLEFLVHAWDYAQATGQQGEAPDSMSRLTCWAWPQGIITPQGRTTAGFDDPVDVPAERARAGPADRLHRPQPNGQRRF